MNHRTIRKNAANKNTLRNNIPTSFESILEEVVGNWQTYLLSLVSFVAVFLIPLGFDLFYLLNRTNYDFDVQAFDSLRNMSWLIFLIPILFFVLYFFCCRKAINKVVQRKGSTSVPGDNKRANTVFHILNIVKCLLVLLILLFTCLYISANAERASWVVSCLLFVASFFLIAISILHFWMQLESRSAGSFSGYKGLYAVLAVSVVLSLAIVFGQGAPGFSVVNLLDQLPAESRSLVILALYIISLIEVLWFGSIGCPLLPALYVGSNLYRKREKAKKVVAPSPQAFIADDAQAHRVEKDKRIGVIIIVAGAALAICVILWLSFGLAGGLSDCLGIIEKRPDTAAILEPSAIDSGLTLSIAE